MAGWSDDDDDDDNVNVVRNGLRGEVRWSEVSGAVGSSGVGGGASPSSSSSSHSSSPGSTLELGGSSSALRNSNVRAMASGGGADRGGDSMSTTSSRSSPEVAATGERGATAKGVGAWVGAGSGDGGGAVTDAGGLTSITVLAVPAVPALPAVYEHVGATLGPAPAGDAEALQRRAEETEGRLREEVKGEFATRLADAEAEAADAEAELDDLRVEIVSLRRREESAVVTALEARGHFADFERQRDVAETLAAVERRAKEEALEEAKASRLAEQSARDVICAAMEEADAARGFAVAADARAAAAVERAAACEAFGDAAALAAEQSADHAKELAATLAQLTELVDVMRPELDQATRAATSEQSTVRYLRMRLAAAAAAAAPALERAANAESELAAARESASTAECTLLQTRCREAVSEGASQQEAAAAHLAAAAARQAAAAAELRAAAAEEELVSLRIKVVAADKVISRIATDRAVHALATKAGEASMESAQVEARRCREEAQRLRAERDAALYDVERRDATEESAAAAIAKAERREAAAAVAEAEVTGFVEAADAKTCAMAQALRALIDEMSSAEAAAGAARRRPLATDRAVDAARKLLDIEAAASDAPPRPSSVPCAPTSSGMSQSGEEEERASGGGGAGRSTPSPGPHSHRNQAGWAGDTRDQEGEGVHTPSPPGREGEANPIVKMVLLPKVRVDSLPKQNRRPASGHAVPSPRSRARNLLVG